MVILCNKKQLRRTRNREGVLCRDIEFDAITVETTRDEWKQYGKLITRNTNDNWYYHGIDKICYIFPRDYLDEKGHGCKYKNGAVTITLLKNFEYFLVCIHKEYIPQGANLKEYVRDVFKYIVYCTSVFKLPVKKTVIDYRKNGEITETEYPENNVTTPEEVFERIYSQRKLHSIELCFDMHLNLYRLFNPDEFNKSSKCGNTLYSKDYRVYESKNRKLSMLCIYDKAEQLWKKKHRRIYCTLWRFELRLFTASFTIMKNNGDELLNRSYEELLETLEPHLRRHIRKLGIIFDKFLSALPDNQCWLRKLLSKL